jgi:hypothetical protein
MAPTNIFFIFFLIFCSPHFIFSHPTQQQPQERIGKIEEEIEELRQHEHYFRGKANQELRKSQAFFQDDLTKYAADIKDLGHYNKIADEIEQQINILEQEKEELAKQQK